VFISSALIQPLRRYPSIAGFWILAGYALCFLDRKLKLLLLLDNLDEIGVTIRIRRIVGQKDRERFRKWSASSRGAVMWWLTYLRSGETVGVVVIEAPSLIDARMRAALEAVEAGVDFAEGHEIDAARSALVPAEQLERLLSIEEANQLLKGTSKNSDLHGFVRV
jgi:hypothetical protein